MPKCSLAALAYCGTRNDLSDDEIRPRCRHGVRGVFSFSARSSLWMQHYLDYAILFVAQFLIQGRRFGIPNQ